MLRLSKKADYALMAMKHLALRGDRGSSSAREIAEQYDIPIELMAKVPAASGPARAAGCRIRARAAAISWRASRLRSSVADVIQAIDGPVTVTACSTDDGQCEQFSKCNVRDPLWRCARRFWRRSASARSRSWRPIHRLPAPGARRGAAYARMLSLTRRDMAVKPPIYMDYHATTPVDPRVVEAMLPSLHRSTSATRPAATIRSAGRRRRRSTRPASRWPDLIGANAEGDRLHERRDRVRTTWRSRASPRCTARRATTSSRASPSTRR